MQPPLSELDDVPGFDLKVLSQRLLLAGMPVQAIVAKEAGVSQSTVSRAVQGLIRGRSSGAMRLWVYATGRMADLQDPPTGTASAPMAKASPAAPVRSRAARLPHRRAELRAGDRKGLEAAAIDGLKRYLDDAFDPQLIIEQLAVLRRAQDRSARAQAKD